MDDGTDRKDRCAVNIDIRDRPALGSIPIINLRSYLASRGWTDSGKWGERPVALFAAERHGRTWEVLVPLRDTLGGYAENMADAISVLAAVEERSQLDIYNDLVATGADVVYLRSPVGSSMETPSIRQSSEMLSDAYKMLEAGARAVEKPRAIYRGKLSADVAEYLDNVKPMPGFSASFDLMLRSPVPMSFDTQQDLGDDFQAPFPRLVTHKLAEGLKHTSEAVESVLAQDNLDSFKQGINRGISANLCDSIADLAHRAEGITIGLSWAGVRPANIEDSTFRFSSASADILTEAAKSLRTKETSFDETIMGLVVRLEKEPGEFDGRATIASIWDGRLTRMNAEFEKPLYEEVIRAFRDQVDVSLEADVHPSGNAFQLRNIRNLVVHANAAQPV